MDLSKNKFCIGDKVRVNNFKDYIITKSGAIGIVIALDNIGFKAEVDFTGCPIVDKFNSEDGYSCFAIDFKCLELVSDNKQFLEDMICS